MSVIEIKDRDDLRAGDTATFAYNGHEFAGVVWDEKGQLFIGRTRVYDPHGGWSHGLDFVRASREMPPLPTEPGSVILVTECRGERTDGTVIAWWNDVERYWTTPTHRFGGKTAHDAWDFTEWTPAKVVPA